MDPKNNGYLSPYDVTPGSNIKVWRKFRKEDKHEWKNSSIIELMEQGCPPLLLKKR